MFNPQMHRLFSSCTESTGPSNIAEIMENKLKEIYKDDSDQVYVIDNDGGGQKVGIYVVSDQFKGMLPLARHRKINEILKTEIA